MELFKKIGIVVGVLLVIVVIGSYWLKDYQDSFKKERCVEAERKANRMLPLVKVSNFRLEDRNVSGRLFNGSDFDLSGTAVFELTAEDCTGEQCIVIDREFYRVEHLRIPRGEARVFKSKYGKIHQGREIKYAYQLIEIDLTHYAWNCGYYLGK